MMKNKTIYFAVGGIIVLILTTFVQSFILSKCSGLGCLFLVAVFALPGLLLQDVTGFGLFAVRVVNTIFYFLIGGIIGLIIYKLKQKKK